MPSQKNVRVAVLAALCAFLVSALTGCPLLFTGNQAGSVLFSAAPATGPAPLKVVFVGKPILAAPYEAQAWNWDFGDGTTGEGLIATHCFLQPGTYDVTLSVAAAVPKFRGEGDFPPATLTATRQVVVINPNQPPVADAGPDQSVYLDELVTLDGSGSYDPDSDPITYAWTIVSAPAESAAGLSGADTVNPTFAPDLKGDYEFQLIVNDGELDSAPDTVVVSVLNRPPVADAGEDQTVFLDVEVTFDGSGSSDPDFDPLTYSWSLIETPPLSAAELSGADTVNPTFTPDLKGLYIIQLIVNDGTVNSGPDYVEVTVPNRPPEAVAVVLPEREPGATVYREEGPVTPNLDALYALPRWGYGEKAFWGEMYLSLLDPDTASVLGQLPITIILDNGGYLLPISVSAGYGLAVDPTTGEMWALLEFSIISPYSGSYRALARVNPYTGVAVAVGDPIGMSLSELYAGLAVDEQSIVYGVTGNMMEQAVKAADAAHSLYTIDPVTTLDSFVFEYPEPGPNRTPGEVIAFNTDDGLMYHATGGGAPESRLFRSLNLDTFDLTTVSMPVEDVHWNRPTALTYAPGTNQFYLADVASEIPYLFRITLDTATTATEQYIGELFLGEESYYQPPAKGLAFIYETPFTNPLITLDGSDSSDPDGDALTYAWSFQSVPTGSSLTNADLSDPTGITTSFTPDVLGTYVVQLVVNDGEVDSAPDTVTVELLNQPPLANAGADQVVPMDDYYYNNSYPVQLNGDGSYDPDGTELTFDWTVTSVPTGSSFDDTDFDTTSAAPSLYVDVANDTVPYVFQLTVTDGDGASATDTVQIIVQEPDLPSR